MTTNLKTVLHTYCFDTSDSAQKESYLALREKLRAMGLKCFETHGGKSHYLGSEFDGAAIELETAHLFSNQWNTAPIDGLSEKGYRVFDWAQDSQYAFANHSARVKRGHWLEQTRAMRDARDNTNKCGYCGKQEPAQKGDVFCPHCIDSEYLTSETLHLTRMVAVSHDDKSRGALSEAERAHLLPLFREAQIHGTTERGKARIAKARKDIDEKFARVTRNAKTERDGFLFFLDRGIRTDNLIFYSHTGTGTFCFGWRTPVESDLLGAVLEIISEFPFPYEIKTASNTSSEGRTLSGGVG